MIATQLAPLLAFHHSISDHVVGSLGIVSSV